MTLLAEARAIARNNRNAGHSWRTVYAALQYVSETSVNEATSRMRELRDVGLPRWLVQRWAADAGLADPRYSH